MSQNKYMHPRNKYRKTPDFKALAIKYPEFRKHSQQDISGRIKYNFKDLEALRVLTQTLLKEDFDLDVELPPDRLVPTLPLRLNYLLWIEDVIKSNDMSSDKVMGIDIGCGASCVYPLLAAKQFKWHMLGTEVDTESASIASSNVSKNNLQALIKVRTVEADKVLEGVIDADIVYDFCMCNPPFFSFVEELEPQNVARTSRRPLPRNAHSGAPHELVVEGGELAFINRIIQDSLKLKDQIRVFSVMVGHKLTLEKAKQALIRVGIRNMTTTRFCQGRTTRWGIAWTLKADVKWGGYGEALNQKKNQKKQFEPFSYTFKTDLASTVERLKKLMDNLQIAYSSMGNHKELVAMEIIAEKNTWSNSRKKRRQEKFKQLSLEESERKEMKTEKVDLNDEQANTDDRILVDIDQEKGSQNEAEEDDSEMSEVKSADCLPTVSNENIENPENEKGKKRAGDEAGYSENDAKRVKTENPTSTLKKNIFLRCTLVVKKSPLGSVVEIGWLQGDGGRLAASQVLQYFQNN